MPPRPAGPATGAVRPPPPPPDALRLERSAVLERPKPKVLARRKSTLNSPGPLPKSRGRIFSPGVGLGSSNPYDVAITPGILGLVAMPGRAVSTVSPYT